MGYDRFEWNSSRELSRIIQVSIINRIQSQIIISRDYVTNHVRKNYARKNDRC